MRKHSNTYSLKHSQTNSDYRHENISTIDIVIKQFSTPQVKLVLLTGLILAAFMFSIVFYTNQDFYRSFLPYRPIYGPQIIDPEPTVTDILENYRALLLPYHDQSYYIDYNLRYHDFNFRRLETLTYKSTTYHDDTIEILYRFPKTIPISAVLLIFHACGRRASDWFHTIERQRVIGGAIELGFACLVFQSTDKVNRCWSHQISAKENKDVDMILKALDGFYYQYPHLEHLPRFTFGWSSGGIFASILATNQLRRISGQVLYASIIPYDVLHTYVKQNQYPPTVWIRMGRDIELATEQRLNISSEVFLTKSVLYTTLVVHPIRIKRGTFQNRIPTLNILTSDFIYKQLQMNNWLNGDNFLKYNPRRISAWRKFLFSAFMNDSHRDEIFNDLKTYGNEISHFLHVTYCEHEISHERSYEAFKWLKDAHNLIRAEKSSEN